MHEERETRAAGASAMKRVPLSDLHPRQREVLDYVVRYYRTTQEPCSAAHLSRRLSVDESSIRRHFFILHRKGWLRGPNTPATPTRW